MIAKKKERTTIANYYSHCHYQFLRLTLQCTNHWETEILRYSDTKTCRHRGGHT